MNPIHHEIIDFGGFVLVPFLNSEWFTWPMIALDIVAVGYVLTMGCVRFRRPPLKLHMYAVIALKCFTTLMITGEFFNDYYTFVMTERGAGGSPNEWTVGYACQIFHNDLILIPLDQLAVFIVLFASAFILLRGHQRLGGEESRDPETGKWIGRSP